MEFNEEQIKDIGLSEEQLPKLLTIVNNNEAFLKKEWDGVANMNAEKILEGAAYKVEEITGIKREQGEKIGDFIGKAGAGYVSGLKATLERKQEELEEKIKNTKGDDILKSELQTTKSQLDTLKQKEATYDELEKYDYKGKYEDASEKLTRMERRIAFNSVTPTRPELVNKYEWDAKLKEWRKDIEEKNNIVLDENDTPWVVDKENEFKKTKLEDLLKINKEINELISGHTPKGIGVKPADQHYSGVPFKVPSDVTPEERAKLIRDYLVNSENLEQISTLYAKRYNEINKAIMEKNPAKT